MLVCLRELESTAPTSATGEAELRDLPTCQGSGSLFWVVRGGAIKAPWKRKAEIRIIEEGRKALRV